MSGERGRLRIDGGNVPARPAGGLGIDFPSLPIVTPNPPRLGRAEKYGGLFYLGVGGLLVLAALVGWFSVNLWLLRDVWTNIYILHDPGRPEARRIQAAYALSRDPSTTDRQRWDVALRTELPELARYLVAESLGPGIVADDPRGHPLAVARSPDWPGWLRALAARPIALAAADGTAVPTEPLEELRNHADPMIGLWAAFAEAVSPQPVDAAVKQLDETARSPGPARELAVLLQAARSASGDDRRSLLAQAALWLRSHHPEAIRIWNRWEIQGDALVNPTPTPARADPTP